MIFAERFFWLDTLIDGTKQTQRQALEQVAKQTGKDPNVYFKLPEVNTEVLYLLKWFFQLKKTPDPLTYSELDAWSRMTRNFPNVDEVEALMKLDVIYSRVSSKSQNSQTPKTKKK